MNYSKIVRGPLESDTKFKNVVKSIMDFTSVQLANYHGQFATKKQYLGKRGYIEYQLEHPETHDKFGVLSDLESMIIYLPPPKIKKVVHQYYDAQMTSYCYNIRGFSKEIPGYQYKSDNIVDLLEEVEKVYNERKNNCSMGFSPKPFCFSKWYTKQLNHVYLPRIDVWEDKDGNRECMCVHMCKKFLTYPVNKNGIRCIPENAKCDATGRRCSGSCIFRNGVNTGITKDLLDNKYIIDAETKYR